ncbi:MAG: hypothetical protein A2W93_12835 [Bacteroidetes bacterium GWF2_43_63]|nr:MAG: hypothetical protein A2W94_06480 [Bacteroidetes bacterium GWE2_42_42]OFY54666.1 MAG: hypothetical protein A2W93_12835 [Bacteroidetes bacterium GWF2_43_63]
MDKNFYRIDELSRGTLGNLEKDPPPMSFDKIRKRVFWYSVWSLGIGSFLRRFWSIPVAAAVVAVILYQIPSAGSSNQVGNSAYTDDTSIPSQYSQQVNFNTSISGRNQNETFSYNPTNNASKNSNDFSSAGENQYISQNSTGSISGINNGKTNPEQALTTNDDELQNPITQNNGNSFFDDNTIKTIEDFSAEVFNAPEKMPVRHNIIPFQHQSIQAPFIVAKINKSGSQISWSGLVKTGVLYSGPMFSPASENRLDINRNFSLSTHFGLEARADFGKWFIAAGVQQSTFDNRYASDHLLYNARTENVQNLTNQFWLTDSIGYWHFTYVSDTTIHVLDSVWAWEIDSALVQEFDTISIAKYDTLQNARWKRNIRYLELPVMIGKTISVSRLTFGLSGGFGFGILYNSEGEYYLGAESGQVFSVMAAETKKICFSFLAAGSVSYLLNERWAVEVVPWYRKMLTPVFSGEMQGTQKPWSAGLSAGIRYNF